MVRVLAKPEDGDRYRSSFVGHTRSVVKSAREMFRGHFLRRWCSFFNIGSEQRFLKHLIASAYFHDFGKLNEEFQAMMRDVKGFHTKHGRQTLRHELLSLWFLFQPDIVKWLSQSDIDLDVVRIAVVGHHLKNPSKQHSNEVYHYLWEPYSAKRSLDLYFKHSQARKIMEEAGLFLGITKFTGSVPDICNVTDMDPNEKIENHIVQFGYSFDDDAFRFAVAVKFALINADALGSACGRSGVDIVSYVSDLLHSKRLTAKEILEFSLSDLRKTLESNGKKLELRGFQKDITNYQGCGPIDIGGRKRGQYNRVALNTSCGSGKTVASWHYTSFVHEKRSSLWSSCIAYPTTSTSMEGYRLHISHAEKKGKLKSSLVHSSVLSQLDYIYTEDSGDNAEDLNNKLKAQARNSVYDSFSMWGRDLVVGTPDQFLGFTQNVYGSVLLLPVVVGSSMVLDEFDAFDKRMEGAARYVYKNLDIPMLLMSASLGKSTIRNLKRFGFILKPNDGCDYDLDRSETYQRYLFYSKLKNHCVKSVPRDKKVLWVVNTVGECQELSRSLTALGHNVLCYHSRYKADDRRLVHKLVMDAMNGDKPVIAVTTQVCERSLDIDADMVITELAPINALIQRVGRAFRKRSDQTNGYRKDVGFAQVWVHENKMVLPYESDELKDAGLFVAQVVGKRSSQRDLADLMFGISIGRRRRRRRPERPEISGNPYFSNYQPFREIDDFLTNCVLDSDIPAIKNALQRKEPIDRFFLNAPLSNIPSLGDRPFAGCPKWLRVISSRYYDSPTNGGYGFRQADAGADGPKYNPVP